MEIFAEVTLHRVVLGLRPQSFDRIEPRGAHRGINAEKQADGGGKNQRNKYRKERRGSRDRKNRAYQLADGHGGDHAEKSAQSRENGRFHQKLQNDVTAARAERFAQADFAGALGDAGEHDVHDHYSADDQKYGSDPNG